MQTFKSGERNVAAGQPILSAGEDSKMLYTVMEGLGLRSVPLSDGDRQVVGFVLPGDFVGLQAGVMDRMDHTVTATTQMTLCAFPKDKLWDLFRSCPARAYDLTHLAAREESLLGEALAVIGQKSATERVAWALHKLFVRLQRISPSTKDAVALPYRQQDLADALGLSLVHTNKTLARLRDTGIADWSARRLRVPDPDRLFELTGLSAEPLRPRPLI